MLEQVDKDVSTEVAMALLRRDEGKEDDHQAISVIVDVSPDDTDRIVVRTEACFSERSCASAA